MVGSRGRAVSGEVTDLERSRTVFLEALPELSEEKLRSRGFHRVFFVPTGDRTTPETGDRDEPERGSELRRIGRTKEEVLRARRTQVPVVMAGPEDSAEKELVFNLRV